MEFTITGSGFDLLPNDIVGVVSNDNEDPLQGREQTGVAYFCEVISKSNEVIQLSAAYDVNHSALYLGALCSNDRQTIYWLNESRPLP